MGNVASIQSEKDVSTVEQKDREYLELQCSSIFNDEFVAKAYKNLPSFDGFEVNPRVDAKAKLEDDESLNLNRLVDIFSKKIDANGVSIADFKARH